MPEWAKKLKELPVGGGDFLIKVNALKYALSFDDVEWFDKEAGEEQGKRVEKPKMKGDGTTPMYWFKIKLHSVGVANKTLAAAEKEEEPKKFEKALLQDTDKLYTLELPPGAAKAFGMFADESNIKTDDVFMMVRTGKSFKTIYLFKMAKNIVKPEPKEAELKIEF